MSASLSDTAALLLRVAVGIALVWGIMRFVRRTEEKKQKPLTVLEARVAHKRVDTSAAPLWYALFDLEDGRQTELRLPEETYDLLAVGDVGKLSFRGDEFVRFQRESGE